jgi:trehalose 6-phosphate phosphatase
MIAAMQEILDQLLAAYRRASPLVLLFDYDGTLTPIVEHPGQAVLDLKTRRLLANLADRPRIHLGIISGRELDELKSLVHLPGLYFAGTGGLELELRGFRIIHPHANRMADIIKRIAAQLENQVAVHQGAWLEKKKLGLTVHYRQMPGQLLGSLQATVEEVTRNYPSELRVVQGPKAWEITPAKGWNKGTAVRLILADFGATSDVLLYAGDGANDADAMNEVAAMGGITLGIGLSAPSNATCRLPNQAALMEFLTILDSALEEQIMQFVNSSKTYPKWRSFNKSKVST